MLDSVLGTSLLVFVLRFSLCPFLLLDVFTKLADFLDEVHIIGHNLESVSLVNLTFNLKTLLK